MRVQLKPNQENLMSHISENDSLTKKYYFFSYYFLVTHSDLKGFKKNKITSYKKEGRELLLYKAP